MSPADFAGWREHALPAVVLFGVALVVRVSLLVQISRTPFWEVRNIDSEAYHLWAARIAAGHWAPTEAFYQSPLYAYFLAVLYAVFGDGNWSPRVVQVVLAAGLVLRWPRMRMLPEAPAHRASRPRFKP